MGSAGCEQGSGGNLFLAKSCSIAPIRCLGLPTWARWGWHAVIVGEVAGHGGDGRLGYHKEFVVEKTFG